MEGEMQFGSGVQPKMASIEAVIIRADGKRVNLGTVAYYNRNPIKMLVWRIKQFILGAIKCKQHTK